MRNKVRSGREWQNGQLYKILQDDFLDFSLKPANSTLFQIIWPQNSRMVAVPQTGLRLYIRPFFGQ